MKNTPRIVFFGTPRFVGPVLEALEGAGWLWGVVTSPDRKVGRRQILTPSPIKTLSPAIVYDGKTEFSYHKNTLLTPEKLDTAIVAQLRDLKPDLFVVAAYGKILPSEILKIPKFGSLNIHPSLLPKYRGPSPIQTAILNGDKISGVSIIQMDEKMDHGPIVYTNEIILSDEDTFETLSNKMFGIGTTGLMEIIPQFLEGKIKGQPQKDNEATFTKIVTKKDGYFDLPIGQITPELLKKLDRIIRAYYPWPTAWTRWSFDKVYTEPSRSAQDKNNKIIKFYPNGIIQMEGKNPVRLEDFLRGYPSFPIKKI